MSLRAAVLSVPGVTMRTLHSRRGDRSRSRQAARSPLRALERLEAREQPSISITNLALSGGVINEGSTTVRTLTGNLATPPIASVDLAINWGDGSGVQHLSL